MWGTLSLVCGEAVFALLNENRSFVDVQSPSSLLLSFLVEIRTTGKSTEQGKIRKRMNWVLLAAANLELKRKNLKGTKTSVMIYRMIHERNRARWPRVKNPKAQNRSTHRRLSIIATDIDFHAFSYVIALLVFFSLKKKLLIRCLFARL
ncbi:hypothetical protein Ancab_033766 [Ancistrocladus abbreviatus]